MAACGLANRRPERPTLGVSDRLPYGCEDPETDVRGDTAAAQKRTFVHQKPDMQVVTAWKLRGRK
jgi:hypothetical protein